MCNPKRTTLYTKVTCVVAIFASICTSSLAALPPEPQEWEIDPNIFLSWPKLGAEESKSPLKSPPVSTIHKYLPRTTWPIEYRIKMTMILESEYEEEELMAPGSVGILVKCIEATNEIVLHANTKYLTILQDSVKVFEAMLGKPINSRQIPVVNQTFEVENDFYIIQLGSPCKVQKEYLVEIRFVAEIASDTLTGLYLSTYMDPITNITKRVATTQFEAEHARQMFPNYDDPDFKAVFKIIVGRHAKHSSLSNMNLIKTEEKPGWYWDHYAPTPIMSSYLLAVIVSEFTCVPAPPPGYRKLVEVCGPPHMISNGGGVHSAEVVATILNFYDDFMKQKYPLPKMTSVAIPDFQAGAMENWGLNTYRVRGLIYYPNITSEEYRYRIDLTIAHELAHQNWGNLVTTKLWNQIWLNEGFATYISYFGLKSVSPEYDPDKQWLTGYRRRALLIDGSADTHPLVNVSSPLFYFDGISYSKGASLLKMLENFLTPRVFHEALRSYLAKFAYNTATQWDLFNILDRHAISSGVHPSIASITEIMESWTLQPGYPVIKVGYISNRAILLTQETFVDSPQENVAPARYWYIPITTVHNTLQSTLDKRIPSIWLSALEPSKVVYIEDNFKWIVVNPDASAFSRVLYDEYMSKLLEAQLHADHEAISAVTRSQIIDDAFEGAWAGYARIETALNYTQYLGKELEPVVWSSALSGLGRIYSMFATDETVVPKLKEYIFERIASSLSKIGVEQASHEKGITVLHRGSLLHWAGVLEIPHALQHAVDKVRSWADSSVNSISSDLHSATLCNAVIAGDRDIYDTLLHLFQKESEIDIKFAIARSLGCTKNEDILNELQLNLTKKEFIVKPGMGYDLILKLSRNSLSRKNVLQYFDKNFQEIQNRYDGVAVIAKGLEIAAQYWNTDEQLKQVQYFVQKYKDDLEDVEKILKRAILQIKNNISWMERFSDSVKTWLNNT